MTKATSSRSANGTTSDTEPEPTGQPVTEPTSEDTSGESTRWMVQFDDGRLPVEVVVQGGRGRVSYSHTPGAGRSPGEARFYRNESTKTFDAVLTGVKDIWSDRVIIVQHSEQLSPEPIDLKKGLPEDLRKAINELKRRTTKVEKATKSMAKAMPASAPPLLPNDGRPWGRLTEEEQEELFLQYGSYAEAEKRWTEYQRETPVEEDENEEEPEEVLPSVHLSTYPSRKR